MEIESPPVLSSSPVKAHKRQGSITAAFQMTANKLRGSTSTTNENSTSSYNSNNNSSLPILDTETLRKEIQKQLFTPNQNPNNTNNLAIDVGSLDSSSVSSGNSGTRWVIYLDGDE